MHQDEQRLLIRLLAACDAAWLPIRGGWGTLQPVNVYFARTHFLRSGIPWRAEDSGTAGARMAGMRLLNSVAALGLITVRRLRSVRWPACKPTEKGEVLARALVGLPDLEASRSLVEKVHGLAGAPWRWVSEWELLSVEVRQSQDQAKLGQEASVIEDLALPGQWRGWIESHSDCRGHVRYLVTAAGLAALDTAPVASESSLPEMDPAASELYASELSLSTIRLETAEPEDRREIGMLALPVSMPDSAPLVPWQISWRRGPATDTQLSPVRL